MEQTLLKIAEQAIVDDFCGENATIWDKFVALTNLAPMTINITDAETNEASAIITIDENKYEITVREVTE